MKQKPSKQRSRKGGKYDRAKPRARHSKEEATAPQIIQPATVEIEKPIYGGAFLARVEGKAVFVPLTLPGEQARVRIIEQKPGYATAEAEAILTQAPERTPPRCPYFGPCGGCHYQHADYTAQLRIKQAILRETLERAGVHAPESMDVLCGEPWAYRNRIRLAFDADGHAGYRGRRSHRIIPVDQCPISAPLLVAATTEFAKLLQTNLPDFHPAELALFCNSDESALLVSIFASQQSRLARGKFEQLATALKGRIPALTGMELVIEGRPGAQPQTAARWGDISIAYRTAGFDYRVDHGAFFQVNRWLVEGLANSVAADRKGALAWDLFAGVGLFARRLATGFERVIAVESAPSAAAALAYNLAGTTATAFTMSTLEFLRRNRKGDRARQTVPDLIVVDPPRTGLGPDITSLLVEI
ncbi:MAG TPA: TRAM domain-containing protein, partial [Terracidiphilus sp.]|nr:TRAM domain-containing protein [Terracidiphilus sp.]